MDAPATAWPDSLLALYRAERLALVRLAAMVLGSRALAEEAFHDAVLSVRPRWGQVDQPLAYLRTAVLNRAREIARRIPPSESEPRDDEIPIDLVDLHRALRTLPQRQREAIVLRYVVGLTDPEISAHLNCRQSTVRTLVARAVHALRKELDR